MRAAGTTAASPRSEGLAATVAGLPARLGALTRRALFSVSYSETRFDRRGFRADSREVRQRLEGVGRAFLDGYHHALEIGEPTRLSARLEKTTRSLRGFAYEGAGMALALRDALPGRSDLLRTFLEGPGDRHRYMVQVGAGWALARARRLVAPTVAALSEPLSWLAIDGLGFHEGYFNARKWGTERRPAWLSGYQVRAFDQGLGRSLWFSQGASHQVIADRVSSFAARRRPDLWSGVGLAATYAGGVDRTALRRLADASGTCRLHLAQGCVFAAKARLHAGNPTPHTRLACDVFLNASVAAAAALSDAALRDLPAHSDVERPGYAIWRERIRSLVAAHRKELQ